MLSVKNLAKSSENFLFVVKTPSQFLCINLGDQTLKKTLTMRS